MGFTKNGKKNLLIVLSNGDNLSISSKCFKVKTDKCFEKQSSFRIKDD